MTLARSLLALLTLAVLPALADVPTQGFMPESGFYWNPDQPGRGYAIEVQDRVVFMTIYTYSEEASPANRSPLWFSASGTLTRRTSGSLTYTFSDELQFSEGGQCLGCSFVSPLTTPTGRPIDITFDSPIHGVMTIDGETIELFRFWYSTSIADPVLAMFGQWMVVTDYTDVDDTILPFEGDLLEIGVQGSFDGQATAEGFRGGTDVAVAGSWTEASDFFVIVVGESNSAFLAYYFNGSDFGTDRFIGLAERYVPGGNLTGQGFPAQGYRISDRSFAEARFGAKDAGRAMPSGPPRPMSNKSAAAPAQLDLQQLNATVRMLEARVTNALAQ